MNSLRSPFYAPLVKSHDGRKHSPRSIGKSMPRRWESISDRKRRDVWEARGVIWSSCPPGSRSRPSSYRSMMLKPASLARGQVAGMLDALWMAPRQAPAQAALIWVCLAWQSHFAVLALVTLEGTESQHQRSHQLQERLPEPPAPSA